MALPSLPTSCNYHRITFKHKILKQNWLKSQMRHRISCKLSNNSSTYSSRIATVIDLHESPKEEWRIHMLPVLFLLVTCSPVIDMCLRCKSDGYDYLTGVPPQVTKVLDLTIVRWELLVLEGVVRPYVFSLGVNGTLYPCKQGNYSHLKGQLSMGMTFDLPPVLSLIPEDISQNVAERWNGMEYYYYMGRKKVRECLAWSRIVGCVWYVGVTIKD